MSSMTISTAVMQVIAGVDTHQRTHTAAVIDLDGREVDHQEFTADMVGYRRLNAWLGRWVVTGIGVESTGTYGAALTRHLQTHGLRVIEVNRPDPTTRASVGKSDPIDAFMAARAVLSGRASAVAKDTSGVIESIRMLHITRGSAVKSRTAALLQLGALVTSAPAELREQVDARSLRATAQRCLRLRPDQTRLADPTQAAKLALRSLAERISDLDVEIKTLDAALRGLVETAAPRLLERPQVGIHAAAQLLITAGQNPDRIGTDAKFARLTGVAPIPASSGKTNRMRLHRGGDRQANKTIHMIAVGRLKNHRPAIDYVNRRLTEGLSKKDAIRAMKRLITRELHGALKADLKALDDL